MSNDKVRAEFEEWASTHFFLQEEDTSVDDSDEYISVDMQLAWETWQASRAALVVELPPAPVPQKRYGGTYTRTESAYHQGQMSVIRSIEAAGIKIKE